MADLTLEQQQALDAFNEAGKQLDKLGIQIDRFGSKSLTSIDERFKKLDKTVEKSGGSYRDVIGQLNDLSDAIEENADQLNTADKKQQVRDQLRDRAEAARRGILKEGATEFLGTVTKGVFNYYTNQIKTGMRGVMNESTSAFQLAADLQIQGATDINNTVQGVAGAATAVGTSLMMLPNPVSIATGAIVAFGGALGGFLSSKYTEYFTEKTRILAQGVESTYNSFLQAASAGALFGGGLTELRAVALRSGLTQDQFTKVVADNRQSLAEAGMGMSDAVRTVGRVTSRFALDTGKSGNTLRDEMLNLGFTIEQQAGLAADVMSTMKRLSPQATVGEVGQATADYAKNLRILAGLTGDDAKKRIEQVKGITDQYAFQKKFLREHNGDTEALLNVQTALGKMIPEQMQAIQQTYLRGVTTNIPMILAGFQEPARQMADILHQNNFNLDEMDNITSGFNEKFKNSDNARLEALSSASSLIGKYGDVDTAITNLLKNAYQINAETLTKVRGEVEAAAKTPDKFQKGVNDSVTALQNMRNVIQTDLTNAIKNFATEVPNILQTFRERLETIGIISGTPRPVAENTLIKPQPGESKESVEKRTVDLNNAQTLLNKVGKKDGGISSGPLSGYAELLHGTEAVVPLPDGKTIPVEMKNPAADLQYKAMQELVDEVKKGNQTTNTNLRDLIKTMKDGNSLSSGILQNSY